MALSQFEKAVFASAIGGLITFMFVSGFGAQTIVDSPLEGETQGNLFGDVCARLSCIQVNPNYGTCELREYVPRCYPTDYVPTQKQLELAGLTVQEPALVTAQPTDYSFSPQATPPAELLTLACADGQLLVNGGCVTVSQEKVDEAVKQYNDNANQMALVAFVLLSAGAYYFLSKKK